MSLRQLHWLREVPGEYYRWNTFEGTYETVDNVTTFRALEIEFVSKGPWVVDPVARSGVSDYRGTVTVDEALRASFTPEPQDLAGPGPDALAGAACEVCETAHPATHRCTECQENMCEKIAYGHVRAKMSKDHTVNPIGGAGGAAAVAVRTHQMNFRCPEIYVNC